jgi:hypothetical protein
MSEYPPVGTLMQCHISDQFYTIRKYFTENKELWVIIDWDDPKSNCHYPATVLIPDIVCTDLIKALL